MNFVDRMNFVDFASGVANYRKFAVFVNFVIFVTFDGSALQLFEYISLILLQVWRIIINFAVFANFVSFNGPSWQPFE